MRVDRRRIELEVLMMGDRQGRPPSNGRQFAAGIESRSCRDAWQYSGRFPDGTSLVEGLEGDKYLISESGIFPERFEIWRVHIRDLSQVLQHQIACVHETTSHTLQCVGGVFSFMRH